MRIAGKEGGNFFQGRGGERVQFLQKKPLKFEIFNNKKVYKQKYFSLSSLRIQTGKMLTKNLVTFKRYDGIKDEKL